MTASRDSAIIGSRTRIGVVGMQRLPAVDRLLASLESIFPVRFEHVQTVGVDTFDAALIVGPASLSSAPSDVPRLMVAAPRRRARRERAVVALADEARVQRPLRGRAIREDDSAAEFTASPPSRTVLASVGRKPVWWLARGAKEYLAISAYPLARLTGEQALRDHLKPGRFMGLLPVLHFLEAVVGPLGWRPSVLRASFVIDDPNLHWPSYSYLDFPDMVAHADRHGYHVGLAMVPLDGWMANRRAASLVKSNPSALSLMMHGNDHRARELGRLTDERAAVAVIAQALRRTAAFERRSGVSVQRVMVPPHEVCSKPALRAMFRLGLDGACIGQRYPWRTASGSVDAWPLAKWHGADMVVGGMPILPRCPFDRPREDLAFRALLRQPLILYGHHGDLSGGLDLLAEAADYVNSLGDVQWGPLGWIAERNVLSRRRAEALIVQMHSRRAAVELPQDATLLEVTLPSLSEHEPARSLVCGSRRVQMTHDGREWTSGLIEVVPGTRLALELKPEHALDATRVASPRMTPWPLVRRTLVEGRDRVQPLSHRIRATSSA
jgi:hypothetical protein